ncbi:MAG: DNA repair protein RecN [Thiotrichales bacterium]|nr:DNA repair protein RecN [Thiotrichales bacterium]
MLEHLNIKNLVVVEELNIEFKFGMTVITGETGAGKSILIQALKIVAGSRSDASLVRNGAAKAEITASFSVRSNTKLKSYLESQDLENDAECILRRVIVLDGKSRSYVNGRKVPLSILSDIGSYLIDMHGQNEHQLLLRTNHHRILLDDFARSQGLCDEVNDAYSDYHDVKNKIEAFSAESSLLSSQKDLLMHQIDELNQAQINMEEVNNIEDDYKASVNSSQLIEKISKILNSLNHDLGVNNILIESENLLDQSIKLDSRLDDIRELISSAQLQVQESVYDLTDYLSKISNQEDNLTQLSERITLLHGLGRKHNCQITELVDAQKSLEEKVRDMGSSSEALGKMHQELGKFEKEYFSKSKILTQERKKASKILSKEVTLLMQNLGMPGSEIIFKVGPPGSEVKLNGVEDVSIQVKTNVGQDFKPLNKVASGGELSRISLALSVSGTNTELIPCVVFDEVDVGISGSVAEIVGQMLKKLSIKYQIICVTHLAQVAAQGKDHIKVEKTQKDGLTYTSVTNLSKKERADEVARILGGIEISHKTRIAAEEMIDSGS